MLGFEDLMPDCSLGVSCIRKVLRPANSIKVFVVFLGPRANGDLALQVGEVSDETVK
jgi:hypothetical protein